MTAKRQSLGKKGEELARLHLQKQGYKIVTANYRTKNGEIDLIARDGKTLVFVEVKTRSGAKFGSPFDAVNEKKCRQISKVALEYLTRHGGPDQPARFDVVAVRVGERAEVELLRNAFDFCYEG